MIVNIEINISSTKDIPEKTMHTINLEVNFTTGEI